MLKEMIKVNMEMESKHLDFDMQIHGENMTYWRETDAWEVKQKCMALLNQNEFVIVMESFALVIKLLVMKPHHSPKVLQKKKQKQIEDVKN